MKWLVRCLPVAALVVLVWRDGLALGAAPSRLVSRVDVSNTRDIARPPRMLTGAANVYYLLGSDGSFSLTAETEVAGTITMAPAPLVVNKVQMTPSWTCQTQIIAGIPSRYQCIQQGVPTPTTIQGSGTVTIKNAFGTTGNNGTATFSFSCGQVNTKGCSGTISLKMPKLAQGL